MEHCVLCSEYWSLNPTGSGCTIRRPCQGSLHHWWPLLWGTVGPNSANLVWTLTGTTMGRTGKFCRVSQIPFFCSGWFSCDRRPNLTVPKVKLVIKVRNSTPSTLPKREAILSPQKWSLRFMLKNALHQLRLRQPF